MSGGIKMFKGTFVIEYDFAVRTEGTAESQASQFVNQLTGKLENLKVDVGWVGPKILWLSLQEGLWVLW